MLELVIGIMVMLGLGAGIGYKAQPKEPKPYTEPSNWHPSYHQKMIKICGLECKILKSYNTRTGECTCYRGKKGR